MALKTPLRPFYSSSLYSTLKCKHFSRKPTNSNSKNDFSSLFNTSCPEALHRFLKDKCRSANVSTGEAHYFFDCMIRMQPPPRMSSFTVLFTALAKNKHYYTAISLIKRFISNGLLADLIILNILLNCLCNLSRASDGFVVFGRILRKGFRPDVVTFSCLIKGFCREGRIVKATYLFKNMTAFGCRPDVVTFGILINGLSISLEPDVITYNIMINGLCIDGKLVEANDLLSVMEAKNCAPDVITFNTLMRWFLLNNETTKVVKLLLAEKQDGGKKYNDR